jgi:hypothetical protein
MTVPALEDVQSVAELLAPIGRNGGKYLESGFSTSLITLLLTGFMMAGPDSLCRRKRLERRS